MKQDNGNHAATPGLWKQGYGPDSWLLEATAEIDRLKAINAELVEALEEYLDRTEVFVKASVSGGFDEETIPGLIKKARATLAKARKEG